MSFRVFLPSPPFWRRNGEVSDPPRRQNGCGRCRFGHSTCSTPHVHRPCFTLQREETQKREEPTKWQSASLCCLGLRFSFDTDIGSGSLRGVRSGVVVGGLLDGCRGGSTEPDLEVVVGIALSIENAAERCSLSA